MGERVCVCVCMRVCARHLLPDQHSSEAASSILPSLCIPPPCLTPMLSAALGLLRYLWLPASYSAAGNQTFRVWRERISCCHDSGCRVTWAGVATALLIFRFRLFILCASSNVLRTTTCFQTKSSVLFAFVFWICVRPYTQTCKCVRIRAWA